VFLRAGIVTSLLVSLLGQARIYVVLGREQLLPSWFARIHPTRDTPMRAAIFTGCTAGARVPRVCVVRLTLCVSMSNGFRLCRPAARQ
jgi:amino acid transporter